MTNYTKTSKAVIFVAPAQRLDYITRKESNVSGELKPGTVVQEKGGKFVASDGTGMQYVLDRDHLAGKWVDGSAYADGDRAAGFWPQDGLILNVLTAGSLEITEDDPLYVGANGILTTDSGATAGDDTNAATPASPVYGYAAETINTGDSEELVSVKFI